MYEKKLGAKGHGYIHKIKTKGAPLIRTLVTTYFERFLVYIKNISFENCKKLLKKSF